MNFDEIQERLPDIQQLRNISQQNADSLDNIHGRNPTDTYEGTGSFFSFRFFLAVVLLGLFLWTDKQDMKIGNYTTTDIKQTLSYNLSLEDIKSFCYTDEVKEFVETLLQK